MQLIFFSSSRCDGIGGRGGWAGKVRSLPEPSGGFLRSTAMGPSKAPFGGESHVELQKKIKTYIVWASLGCPARRASVESPGRITAFLSTATRRLSERSFLSALHMLLINVLSQFGAPVLLVAAVREATSSLHECPPAYTHTAFASILCRIDSFV
eukprot:s1638_g2.t1